MFIVSKGIHGLATATWHMSHMGCPQEGAETRTRSVLLLEGKERKVRAGRRPHNISWLPFMSAHLERLHPAPYPCHTHNVYIAFNRINMSYFNIYSPPYDWAFKLF